MVLKNISEEVVASKYIQTCDIPVERFKVEPFIMVIFGGTGNLSKMKLLPALFHLYQENELDQGFSVLGHARSPMGDEQYRNRIKEAIQGSSENVLDEKKWDEFSKHLFYFSGVLEDDENYKNLCTQVERIFIPTKFYVANWRWAGVPFYVRTGKRMPKRITEIAIEFDQPPLKLVGRTCDVLEPNVLVLTIQPEEKVSLRFGVKYPYAANQIYNIHMDFRYQETFKTTSHPTYERLLIDCMRGDLTLFVRQDGIEAMWNVVDPIISRWERVAPQIFPNYPAGTWGPAEANHLVEQESRRWMTLGVWKTTLINELIVVAYYPGISPYIIYLWYHRKR